MYRKTYSTIVFPSYWIFYVRLELVKIKGDQHGYSPLNIEPLKVIDFEKARNKLI